MIFNNVKELESGLALVSRVRGFSLKDGPQVIAQKIEKGLFVSGDNGSYTVGYSEKAYFFRGVALLAGCLEQGKTKIDIVEANAFQSCGGMLECSRNAVPKVERVEELLATMAMMGMNSAMLYTEDTYEVEGYPYFGYRRGRYSMQELKHLDAVAQSLGIELIPCIQTLAHLKTALRWNWTDGMRDNTDILLIDEPRTYEFVEAMFRSVRTCFTTNKIHIGMDEAHDVGRGGFLDRFGHQNHYEVMCRHLAKVCDLAKKYDFEPMMWSDMFFRMGNEKKIYYAPNAKMPENISQMIPDNVDMVYWDYYGVTDQNYRDMLRAHEKLGRPVIFAGGVWKWRGMAPNNALTFETTRHALTVCRQEKVQRVFATMWGDDGAEVSQYAILLGMQYFAEYNFYEAPTMEQVLENFNLCTGLSGQAQLALSIDDVVTTDEPSMRMAFSKQILYSDITQGLMDKHLENYELDSWYDEKLQALENLNTAELPLLYEYYKTLIPVLKDKWDLGIRIRKAYKAGNKEELTACAAVCGALEGKYRTLRDKAFQLWMWENKPQGFEMFDLRLSGMAGRCASTQKRLEGYLSGELDKLEELEEEILYFDRNRANMLPHECRFRKVFATSTEFGVYI